jgi:molybdenum cofactor sulfurtransferase
MIPNSFIEYSASKKNISLRTGCVCNPGGAAAILGFRDDMRKLRLGMALNDFETLVGREVGVTRISLGIASSFWDVWKVIQFAAAMGDQKSRQALWDNWMDASGIGHAI